MLLKQKMKAAGEEKPGRTQASIKYEPLEFLHTNQVALSTSFQPACAERLIYYHDHYTAAYHADVFQPPC